MVRVAQLIDEALAHPDETTLGARAGRGRESHRGISAVPAGQGRRRRPAKRLTGAPEPRHR